MENLRDLLTFYNQYRNLPISAAQFFKYLTQSWETCLYKPVVRTRKFLACWIRYLKKKKLDTAPACNNVNIMISFSSWVQPESNSNFDKIFLYIQFLRWIFFSKQSIYKQISCQPTWKIFTLDFGRFRSILAEPDPVTNISGPHHWFKEWTYKEYFHSMVSESI